MFFFEPSFIIYVQVTYLAVFLSNQQLSPTSKWYIILDQNKCSNITKIGAANKYLFCYCWFLVCVVCFSMIVRWYVYFTNFKTENSSLWQGSECYVIVFLLEILYTTMIDSAIVSMPHCFWSQNKTSGFENTNTFFWTYMFLFVFLWMKNSTERNHQHYIEATDAIGKCRIMGHLDLHSRRFAHMVLKLTLVVFFPNQHGIQKRIVLSSNI